MPEVASLVVIGSGWAGLYLAQHVDPRLYNVTIISPRPTCAITPLLASAAVGLLPFSTAEEPIRSKLRGGTFIQAKATRVDFAAQQVECQADDVEKGAEKKTFEISYDYLVICPGCRTNTFGTPGVEEYGLFMKDVPNAMELRRRLFANLEKASLPFVSDEDRKRLLHVAIVGGGPTGVEITAELSDLAKGELKGLYPAVADLITVSVYDVADHILGAYDQKLYEYATEKLCARGVEVKTGTVIEKVDEHVLHIKGSDAEPYGILLWVAGNNSVHLVDNLDVKKTEKGLPRIITDDKLRVRKAKGNDVYSNVFALGDAADIEGHPLPTTAEVAIQKARSLVANLHKMDANGHNLTAFDYSKTNLVTYLGSRDGIMQGSKTDAPYSGHAAWVSWRTGSLAWSRTWRSWANVGWAMATNFFFGKNPMALL